MRAVIQRVKNAGVTVAGKKVGTIQKGLLVFLGVGQDDTPADAAYLAKKTAHLRTFQDEQEKMNLSLHDIQGEALLEDLWVNH